MTAVTICSDFGAPQNKVWHCFHRFLIYLPCSDGARCHDLHVWPWLNNREGTQSHSLTENWIKDLLSMAPPIKTRPSFHHSQSLPLGSFHTSLFLFHQRADKLKNTITEKITKLITWTTALSNSVKPSHAWGANQDRQVMLERSDRIWPTGEGNGKPL